MSSNQSVTYLMKRFREAGIHVKSKHGQNFLIDLNLLRLLVESAELHSNDVVLEVGTGTGSLTEHIAPHVAEVVTVEIDAQMYQLASEELYTFNNVTMLRQDALRNKNHLDEQVLDTVREKLAEAPGRCFKLVANLPYNVATPIISNLLACDLPPESMTVTIQKELGERMIAQPNTKDYGALSVWVQSQCEVKWIRTLSPTVFWPKPKVHSAFIQLVLDPARRQAIGNLTGFHAFVRAMFTHRRKLLRSQLLHALPDRIEKSDVDGLLSELQLPPQSRAEDLPVETFVEMFHAIERRFPAVPAG